MDPEQYRVAMEIAAPEEREFARQSLMADDLTEAITMGLALRASTGGAISALVFAHRAFRLISRMGVDATSPLAAKFADAQRVASCTIPAIDAEITPILTEFVALWHKDFATAACKMLGPLPVLAAAEEVFRSVARLGEPEMQTAAAARILELRAAPGGERLDAAVAAAEKVVAVLKSLPGSMATVPAPAGAA